MATYKRGTLYTDDRRDDTGKYIDTSSARPSHPFEAEAYDYFRAQKAKAK